MGAHMLPLLEQLFTKWDSIQQALIEREAARLLAQETKGVPGWDVEWEGRPDN